MELKKAAEILKMLADEVHPITGKTLPEEDSCNQPEVIRALHTVLNAIPEAVDAVEGKQYASRKWTPTDDKFLCQLYDQGYSCQEMCRMLGRRTMGIAARLVQLGKIEERKQLDK